MCITVTNQEYEPKQFWLCNNILPESPIAVNKATHTLRKIQTSLHNKRTAPCTGNSTQLTAVHALHTHIIHIIKFVNEWISEV